MFDRQSFIFDRKHKQHKHSALSTKRHCLPNLQENYENSISISYFYSKLNSSHASDSHLALRRACRHRGESSGAAIVARRCAAVFASRGVCARGCVGCGRQRKMWSINHMAGIFNKGSHFCSKTANHAIFLFSKKNESEENSVFTYPIFPIP